MVALGEDEPDALVVALDVGLLVRGAGVAVEEVRDAVALAVELDGERVAELGPVVGYQKFLITDIIRNPALSGISDAA